jgi:signal transduction histidine kinase
MSTIFTSEDSSFQPVAFDYPSLCAAQQAVTAAIQELLSYPSVDTILRRAVELGREKLGLGRCGIFLFDQKREYLQGTYGTNFERETVDERGMRVHRDNWWDAPLFAPDSRNTWVCKSDGLRHAWTGERVQQTELPGWVVAVRIDSAQGPLGVFFNDSGHDIAPFDPLIQECVVTYCSLLGGILLSKQHEESLRSVTRHVHCILWRAEVEEIDGKMVWDQQIQDEEAAQEVLPLQLEPGQEYKTAWWLSRHPEDNQRMAVFGAQMIRAGEQFYQQEFRCYDRSGIEHWLKEDVSLQSLSPGHWQVFGVCTDISEQKRMERELRHLEMGARCLLWHAAVHEENGHLQWQLKMSNPEAAQKFLPLNIEGYHSYSDAFFASKQEEDLEALHRRSDSAIRQGKIGYNQEFRVRLSNGDIRWLYEDVRIEKAGPQRWSLFGVCADITRIKRAESALQAAHQELEQRVDQRTAELARANQELQTAKEEAERANAAKSEFLSRMSHELRTPLNAILGFGQLLEMAALPPRQKQAVDHILHGGQHLLQLINEVLDIARVESGRLDIEIEPVELKTIVNNAIDLVQPLAAQHQVQFHEALWGGESYCLLADKKRLKQVLLNLLSNAIKYNRPGGWVSVSCIEVRPGWLEIQVTDTGRGIAAEDLPRLFIPFERLAPTAAVEGTGIGLALCKHLVEAMGGGLDVHSTPERGSTFFFQLPLCAAPLPAVPLPANTTAEASTPPHSSSHLLDHNMPFPAHGGSDSGASRNER